MRAARQPPDKPGVDRSERELAGGPGLAQQPLELRRREVRVGDEPRSLADEVDGELGAPRRGSPVLPDDRWRDRAPVAPVPEDGRLALVRDADRPQLARRDVGVVECVARSGEHRLPDLVGVVLDEPRRGEVLPQLAVPAPDGPEILVDHEARRPRRPLVDRQQHGANLVADG